MIKVCFGFGNEKLLMKKASEIVLFCKSLFILFYSRENLPYYVSKKKASNISKTIAF
jgi:hypothetical protein